MPLMAQLGMPTLFCHKLEADANGNVSNCEITTVDSTKNIIFNSDKTRVALLGVHNLIVVRTGDAVLICHRHQAEKIKNLVGKLPEELQ